MNSALLLRIFPLGTAGPIYDLLKGTNEVTDLYLQLESKVQIWGKKKKSSYLVISVSTQDKIL